MIELANLPKPKFNSHCSSYWTPGFAFDMKENEKLLILDNKATMPSLDFPIKQNADFSKKAHNIDEFIENLNANLQNSQNSN